MTIRYRADELVAFTTALFEQGGMPEIRAQVVAKLLIDADLMGHDTHGLNLAAHYLNELDRGQMLAVGEPVVLNERGPCLTWDGQYLSGVWLAWSAVREAARRAREFGIGVVSVRRSHHIACLATFLTEATDHGMAVLLTCSDPSETGVAPYGAVEPCFTPNPIAFGYPTGADPVLIDISASITTIGMSGRMRKEGRLMPGQWLIDNDGKPSNDPAILVDEPPGALLPLGGIDAGHKGFGLALMVETLTSSLSGHGRADAPTNHGASVLVQVFDPEAFGGLEAFERESSWLADRCRGARVAKGSDPVRLPGERGLTRLRESTASGVELYDGIIDSLEPWAERFKLDMPTPIQGPT